VLVVLLPVLAVLRRHVLAGRMGVIVLSALVAHTGWHWMIDRGEVLWQVEGPRVDAAALATLARWLAGILLAAGAVRFLGKRGAEIWARRTARGRPA
jgi:hypothetical protein